ncbi:MAG: S41 family peptidase [Bacteroidota bacterium]
MKNPLKKIFVFLPIILSITIILGIFLGTKLNFSANQNKIFSLQFSKFNKINEILNYIIEEYVDSIDKTDLTEETVSTLLKNLDPHSAYISANELKAINEPLEGTFCGIGIEFNIINDTIIVIYPIPKGPSKVIGIEAGDRIIRIEDELVAGVGITNKEVINRLRGLNESIVNISIFRKGTTSSIDYTITRGVIPIQSVDVAYMVNDSIGYIRISRFSATTYDEYSTAFEKLQKDGIKELILDLRENPGGYLNSATKLVDEFLEDKKLIVYTKGKSRLKSSYLATSKGKFQKGKLIILIDEGSASASEIIAGAIQDNDRGIIVGRRSFGKGLVQEQFEFPDGSAVRLTVARYFTPTGRCIQKSYSQGNEKYYHEIYKRFINGEFENEASIHFADSLKFTTPGGKIVYGGGGIMPDIFIPIDTTQLSLYLTAINNNNLINQFAFEYADKNRKALNEYKSFDVFNEKFTIDNKIVKDFISYAEKNGVEKYQNALIKGDEKVIKIWLKAFIARYIWNNEGFYPIINKIDNTFQKALELATKREAINHDNLTHMTYPKG